jgi:hypothetical protein
MDEAPVTVPDVLRYASEVLHATRPQPPAVLISDILAELKAKLTAPIEHEPPSKDLEEAISRIDAKIGKLKDPPKNKPDFKAVLEAAHAKPPPPVPSVEAPAEPGPSGPPAPEHHDAKNKKAS